MLNLKKKKESLSDWMLNTLYIICSETKQNNLKKLKIVKFLGKRQCAKLAVDL